MPIILNTYQLNIISIICALLIPLMITGPFLPDLLISLFSIYFLYFSINQRLYNKNYYNTYIKKKYVNKFFLIFIIFCFICILSSLFSDNILVSLKSSLFYFRIGVFAIFISFLIDKNINILKYFYISFLITFSFLVADGLTQHFTGINFFGAKISGIRVSSLFGDELILGSYLSRLFPLFFAIFVIKKNKSKLEIYYVSVLFILIEVLIFISGERTAFFLLNLSTIFIIIFISKYKLLRLTIFLVSFTIIGILNFSNENLYFRYVELTIQNIGLTNYFKSDSLNNLEKPNQNNIENLEYQNTERLYFFSPGHDSLVRTGFNMFLEKPILGFGPKLFRFNCDDLRFAEGVTPCDTHPHNFYIQLLAETGLIGFLFLFGLLLYFIFLVLKHTIFYFFHNKKLLSDYQICLLSGLLITIWPLIPSGSIFNNQLMLFYGLQMGFFKKSINF